MTIVSRCVTSVKSLRLYTNATAEFFSNLLERPKKMKHRVVHTLQKYLLNPPIKLALTIGLPLPGYALLETTGRKSGKPRRTPVGDGHIGNEF